MTVVISRLSNIKQQEKQLKIQIREFATEKDQQQKQKGSRTAPFLSLREKKNKKAKQSYSSKRAHVGTYMHFQKRKKIGTFSSVPFLRYPSLLQFLYPRLPILLSNRLFFLSFTTFSLFFLNSLLRSSMILSPSSCCCCSSITEESKKMSRKNGELFQREKRGSRSQSQSKSDEKVRVMPISEQLCGGGQANKKKTSKEEQSTLSPLSRTSLPTQLPPPRLTSPPTE